MTLSPIPQVNGRQNTNNLTQANLINLSRIVEDVETKYKDYEKCRFQSQRGQEEDKSAHHFHLRRKG